MAWPPPFDCTGALVGAWRLLEFEEFEFDEFELFEELDEFELLDEFEELELFEEFELEPFDAVEELEPGDDDPPVLVLTDELPVVWVEPGSIAAITPAAMTLPKPTVAVAVFSLRLPRSRSATARDT